MNQEQQESKEKINLLLNVINATIKLPKFTEVIEKKKKVSKVTGNIEISLLNNDSIKALEATILNELIKLYPHLAPKAEEPITTENSAQIPIEFKEEETKTND